MGFDPNQIQFENDYQRHVWHIGIHVVPLDISLAKVMDPEIRAGCEQIYRCMMEMLTDMYENVDKYKETWPLDYILHVFAWITAGGKNTGKNKKGEGAV